MSQKIMDEGAGDMFLMVKGARAGLIKGEALDAGEHKDEIEVLSWSWGMESQSDLASGQAVGRATIRDLKIVKKVDRASPPLMSALRTNEPIQARLTLRKAGESQLEYLIIKIEQARVTAINIEAGDPRGGSGLVEHLAFSFNKISVEYKPQGKDGRTQGSVLFDDERQLK